MKSRQLVTFFKTSILAVVCTAMFSSANATTVYKSIGDYGEVKYSQFEPQDGKAFEVIELRSDGRQADTGKMSGKTNEDEKEPPTAEEQRIAQLEAQMAEQKERENAQRCQSLRGNLTNLGTGGRVYQPDGEGGRKFLDDREIEIERDKIQNLINQHCTNNSV